MRALARRIAMASPSDVSGLEALFDDGSLRAEEVRVVLGKTEGNGGRNDFSRELAVGAFARAIARRSGVSPEAIASRVMLSMSGGVEGAASPHAVVFGMRRDETPSTSKRLAIGTGRTRDFAPEEIGRAAQIEETAKVVREVVADLGVDRSDVHLVHVKAAITAPGEGARVGDGLRSDMTHARAASALGVGVALGEIDPARATGDAVASDFELFSSVASVSAKPGLRASDVAVFANAASWRGDLAIAHGVMRDALDADAVIEVLRALGIGSKGRPKRQELERVVGVFAKAEAHPSKLLRGKRHVMLDDDDVSDARWARCTVNAVLASVLGDTAVYVSTRAEHMGPLGGGPLAIVARVEPS